MKPSTTYEWGCEICGKVFTRKERLLVHMTSHMNGGEEEIAQRKAEMGFESNSQSSMSSLSQQQLDNVRVKYENKSANSLLKQPSLLKQSLQRKPSQSAENDEKPLHKADSDESFDMDGEEQSHFNEQDDEEEQQNYSCDLCDQECKSAKELRQHVKSHIESIGGQAEESNMDDEQYDDGDGSEEEEEAENDDGVEDHYEVDDGVDDEMDEEEMVEEGDMVEEDFEDDEVSKRECCIEQISTHFEY